MRVSFLLNWYLNPYHTPIVVAKELGFYQQQGIELSIFEPTDPSDVTKIIGQNEIPLGLKAMVHCYAARNRGLNLTAIGTLLDEPPTGLISLIEKEINSVADLRGKRIGYVGEFGKIMVDQLAQQAGINPEEYETHRIGMNAAHAILTGKVDCAIGLSCFQQVEIEAAGHRCQLLRIDRLAHLGCCCFCSIMFVVNEQFMHKEGALLSHFMHATLQGMTFTRENPQAAFDCLTSSKPSLDTPVYKKIYYNLLPFFAKELKNVERDWLKVGDYAKRLGITHNQERDAMLFTNAFLEPQENPISKIFIEV
jgi:pyrimidine precursor biosynthesis enzyme